MLTPELVEILRAPISEASPCGDDLEYDPAFIALNTAAQGKPEQQFGNTVIPAEEPDWARVADQSAALLRRSRDLRPAVLLLRAATRQQGVAGFTLGLQLLNTLVEHLWPHLHPALDADDDNDPTMRLNALAAVVDERAALRDLYDTPLGSAAGVGTLRVRDLAIARNVLPGAPTYSAAQVEGALREIAAAQPAWAGQLQALNAAVLQFRRQLAAQSGREDALDFSRLQALARQLQKVGDEFAPADAPVETPGENADAAPQDDAPAQPGTPAPKTPAARGEITSRQDALQTLDRVIAYLQRSEPGNPAPFLIERAKKLIGVSFFEIMAELAPDAISTVERVTGNRPSE